MINPKPLCVLIILLVLLMGVYEKYTGNVVSVTLHWGRKAASVHYKTVSGNVLIGFSLVLAAIASFIFGKES